MEQKTTYALYIDGYGYINKSVDFDYHRIVTDRFDWQNDFYFTDNLTDKTLEFDEVEYAKDFVESQMNLYFSNGSATVDNYYVKDTILKIVKVVYMKISDGYIR